MRHNKRSKNTVGELVHLANYINIFGFPYKTLFFGTKITNSGHVTPIKALWKPESRFCTHMPRFFVQIITRDCVCIHLWSTRH